MIKLYIVGGLLLGALLIVAHFVREAGEQARLEERQRQEKANAEFQVRARKGAVDFDLCDRAGGLYDFRAGTCKLSATR